MAQRLFGEQYRPWSFSLCSLLHFPVTSSFLGPNIFLSTLFSKTLSLRSSSSARDQIPRPCTRWFKYDRDCLCVNKSQFVPVIFEPPCKTAGKVMFACRTGRPKIRRRALTRYRMEFTEPRPVFARGRSRRSPLDVTLIGLWHRCRKSICIDIWPLASRFLTDWVTRKAFACAGNRYVSICGLC
jgi:hypothetical protein